MIIKPMLAGKCTNVNKLNYPVLATPKLDGIRCLIIQGDDGKPKAVSRKFKPIPNHYVRKWLEANCPIGFDGELMLCDGTFQQTASGIMRRSGEPNFEYMVFDWVTDKVTQTYEDRMSYFERQYTQGSVAEDLFRVSAVLPVNVRNVGMLEQYEETCLKEGYEGVMVRTPDSPYKCGRSTEREGYLLKIKRFVDSDAVIVGVEEKMHNANPAEKDNLGHTKRSSHKANKVPMGTLGALIVTDVQDTSATFRVGTGFTDETRDMLWSIKDQLLGKVIKYKSQPFGVLNKPRFPVFLGLRSSIRG